MLRQYLESVLGVANDIRSRAAYLLHSSLPVAVAAAAVGSLGDVLLQVGNGMEMEAVDLKVMEGQEEPNNNCTILSLRTNSLLACTLLCLVCYQLSLPNAFKACASAVGISLLLSLSKAVAAVF